MEEMGMHASPGQLCIFFGVHALSSPLGLRLHSGPDVNKLVQECCGRRVKMIMCIVDV